MSRPQARPLRGDEGAKRSAALVLEVLAGVRTPSEASTALGVSTMRYYVLERRALEGMVQALQPRPKGKRRRPEDALVEAGREKVRLERENGRLQALVRAAQRTMGLPPAPSREKTKGDTRRRRRPHVRAVKALALLRAQETEASPVQAAEAPETSRPPDGVGHVDRLEGPEDLKTRLRVLLDTLTGRVSVAQACAALGVSESRLHDLRRQALTGALGALMPKPTGRPVKAESATEREKELEARIEELEVDLQAALVRTELALAMPELFRGKKTAGAGRRPGPPHRLGTAAEAARETTGEHRAGPDGGADGIASGAVRCGSDASAGRNAPRAAPPSPSRAGCSAAT